MTRTRIFIIALGVLVLLGGLGLLRFVSLRRRSTADDNMSGGVARQQLGVGFLPVT